MEVNKMTFEQLQPKHCSELLDTGVISELHDAIQEAKGESAGLADRGEGQVEECAIYWPHESGNDAHRCGLPEGHTGNHKCTSAMENGEECGEECAADPAQGQPKLECWNCHKDIPEDERDLVCCSDCSSQWREIANAKRAAQPQMSAREWCQHNGWNATQIIHHALDRPDRHSYLFELLEAFARLQGERPHVGECNYQTQPIGSPGCLCVVVNRNELRRIMAAPSLPSDLRTWLINFLEGCSYVTPQSSLDEVRNDAKRLLAALSSDKVSKHD